MNNGMIHSPSRVGAERFHIVFLYTALKNEQISVSLLKQLVDTENSSDQ